MTTASLRIIIVLLTLALPAHAAESLVVTQAPGTIAVQTSDWKIVFDEAFNGGPAHWFDLRFDPNETDNLAASQNGAYSQGVLFDYDVYLGTHGGNAIEFMTTLGASADPGSLELTLLESTPARVRILQKGHPRLNNGGGPPGNPFPELPLISFTTLWTLYPTGKVNVDFTTELDPAGAVVDSGPGGAGKSIGVSGSIVQAAGGTDFLATGVWAGDTIESAAAGWGPVSITARTSPTTLQLAQTVPTGANLDFVVRRSKIVMETISIHADGDAELVNQCSDPAISHWQGGSNGDPQWSIPSGGSCQSLMRSQGFLIPPLADDTLLAHWTRYDRAAGSLLVFYEPFADATFGAFNDQSFTDISYTQLGSFGLRPALAQHRHFLAQIGSSAAPSLPTIKSVADAMPYAGDYRAPYAEVLAGTAASGPDIGAYGFDLATGAYGVTAASCSPTATCREAVIRLDSEAAGRAGAPYREPAIELDGFDAGLPAGDADVRVDISHDGGSSWTRLSDDLFNLSDADDEAQLGAGRRVFQYLSALAGSGASAPALRFKSTSQCSSSPRVGCRAARRSALTMGPGSAPQQRRLRWRWDGGPATEAIDFGDPRATTDTSVCIYAGAAQALALEASVTPAEINGSNPRWRAITSGYRYARSEGNADGVTSLRLVGGAIDRSKILLRARGAQVGLPALPLDGSSDVVVQIANSDTAICWESLFAPSSVRINTAARFKAIAP